MFLLCIGITSQFLWSVEVRGVPEEEAGEILSAAELAGVRVGAWIPGLPDGNDQKDTILQNTSQITWAWVYVKGTKAVVEVRKAAVPPLRSVCPRMSRVLYPADKRRRKGDR